MAKRQIRLALSVYGVGGPGQHGLWKDARVPKNASIDIDWYITQATKAEAAKRDALFIVDSLFINATYPPHYLNRLAPLTLLSAVATHTKCLGLIGTLTTTYNSPFNLARRFASLDHISRGRAGWNVVTSFDVGAAKNFGLEQHLDYPTRYGRALEFGKVVQGLWDSYEDDAFPADVEHDRFVDPCTRRVGRSPDHVIILMGARPVVADSDGRALEQARDEYESDNQFHRKLAAFGRSFGAYDFGRHDLDAPFPDVGELAERSGRTNGQKIIAHARENKLTLRETVLAFTKFQPLPFTGNPSTVADAIESWFEARALDGLNLAFRTTEDLDRFTGEVLPLLRRQGLFRADYESDTLRGHLGLPIPENRYTAERRRSAETPAANAA